MKNLEQIRACAALEPAKGLNRKAINKLPAMILSNGLLATIAFCHAESSGENRSEMARALLATARHLAAMGHLHGNSNDLTAVAKDLSDRDSRHLQRVTTEALAFIGYLRRFAQKGKDEDAD
jgi:CRISPR type III-B/RAMP module-associated protein Cmr5